MIFDEDLNIITQKNCATNKDELTPYLKAYDVRDNTIGAGFVLLGEHYEVHRWHPPLIYGRRGDADVGEGISLARVSDESTIGNVQEAEQQARLSLDHLRVADRQRKGSTSADKLLQLAHRTVRAV